MSVDLSKNAEMNGEIGRLEVGWFHLTAQHWWMLVAEALPGCESTSGLHYICDQQRNEPMVGIGALLSKLLEVVKAGRNLG